MRDALTRVVAIDPGLTVGIVVAEVFADDLDILYYNQVRFEDFAEASRYVLEVIRNHDAGDTHVVAERFDLRPGNNFLPELTPVKVNAVLEFNLGPGNITYQTPAQAKRVVTNPMLKQLGYYDALMGSKFGQPDANDVRDAFRHLIYYSLTKLRLVELGRRATA